MPLLVSPIPGPNMTYDTIRPNIRLNAVGSSSSTKHSESYHGVRIPDGLYAHLGVMSSDSELLPQEIYVGSNPIPGQQVKLKIANGGAGQAGLIKAWANAFIDFSVQQLNMQPFSVRLSRYIIDDKYNIYVIQGSLVFR